jgi:hypothetical protein
MLIRVELLASGQFSGDSIVIEGPTQVVSRTLSGGSWSGPASATFVSDVAVPLRITEIHYHPAAAALDSPYGRDDFEFIELQNIGTSPIDLLGVRFTGGIEFEFTVQCPRTLEPDGYVVLVSDLEAFSSRYDVGAILIGGEYLGNLANSGEELVLKDGRGVEIQKFAFDDVWYPTTDGPGFSINLRSTASPPSSWGQKDAWTPSGDLGGSPGAAEGVGGWQIPGDLNQDSMLDISDALATLLYLFGGTAPALPCDGASAEEGGNLALLDVSGDAAVDLSDAVYVLRFLFSGGPPPLAGTQCQRIEGCPHACSPW